MIAKIFHPFEQTFQFNIDNALDGSKVELVEGDNLVETVEELGRELARKTFLNDAARIFLVFFVHGQS